MRRKLQALLPPLSWLAHYDTRAFGRDLLAAIIMTVLVIPQSLAYAILAGMPPEAGLYASTLPVVAYSIFASSATLAVGPVAVIALMSATAVGEIVSQGIAGYAAASMMLALMSGVILVAMGTFRLGFIANFISHPVISGFISGSALLIIISQLMPLLGIDGGGRTSVEMVTTLVTGSGDVDPVTAIIGVCSILFLFLASKYAAKGLSAIGLPGAAALTIAKLAPMIAVIISTLIVAVRGLSDNGVAVVSRVPGGLPALAVPVFDLALFEALLLPAALISLIIFVESTAIAHRLASKRNERVNPNQELVALGAANITAAIAGSFAVAGGFSRSAVNAAAGAQTQVAGVLTALGIALVTLLLTDWLYYLPRATLAAAIIVAVSSLVDIRAIRAVTRYSRADGTALVITLLVTVSVGVTPGILSGIGLSLLLYLHRTSRPHTAVVGRIAGTEHFRNISRHQVDTVPHTLILRIDEGLYFANARYLEDQIAQAIEHHPDVNNLVLMCTAVNHIDTSALETLEAINTRLEASGVRFHLSEVKGPVMDRLRQSDFLAELSGEVFLSTYDAWKALCESNRSSVASNSANT
ncbi:MAG: sodium-independent anion transporter [Alteromonadaceae bacterium]|nr:sodium-independent anion transporter [Alteromonadaceae bacterium]MBH85765.1 sodium-independent anion transporter [Alteromonadaceae bacterium]|tara:strand:+ start:68448 stop:70199 length:1752 start_codon:yes stop_codon:yes gene_type:complete